MFIIIITFLFLILSLRVMHNLRNFVEFWHV